MRQNELHVALKRFLFFSFSLVALLEETQLPHWEQNQKFDWHAINEIFGKNANCCRGRRRRHLSQKAAAFFCCGSH